MSLHASSVSTPVRTLTEHAARFLKWWGGELGGLLPARLRETGGRRARRLLLDVDGDAVQVDLVTGGRHERLARLELGGGGEHLAAYAPASRLQATGVAVTLRLAPGQVLHRRLSLPAAAEENLRAVLGFEMDRQTPFQADQVYYDFAVVGRTEGQLTVELAVIPRARLDALLRSVSALGVQPDVVEVRGLDGVDLLPPERRPRPNRWRRRLNTTLAGVLVMLLVATLAWPMWRLDRAVDALRAEVAAVQSQAMEAAALREALDAGVRQTRFLVEQKQTQPLVIELLDELSQVLPDGTWLYQFELRGRQVVIQGESTASAALIALLEASPAFEKVAFRSPVTQNPSSGRERFQIAAEVIPGGVR
jgi:general secretion pathway protein L